MERINVNEKISIYGNVDGMEIAIEDKPISGIIEDFYNILIKKNLDINKVKLLKVKEIIFENKEKRNKDSIISIYGYSKKRNDDSMRYNFNIEDIKVEDLFTELKNICTEYLCFFEKDMKSLDTLVKFFFVDNNIKCMGKCKDCEYWSQNFNDSYTEDFGDCECNKFAYYQDLYEDYKLDKEKLKNYHVLYDDSEGLFAELKVHKEFGCINFKDRNTYQ